MPKPKKNEIRDLEKLGRIRNRLLVASTLRSELRRAAERVMRLSKAGAPMRFFTLAEVADESGLSAAAIVKEIIRLNKGNPNYTPNLVAEPRAQEEGTDAKSV